MTISKAGIVLEQAEQKPVEPNNLEDGKKRTKLRELGIWEGRKMENEGAVTSDGKVGRWEHVKVGKEERTAKEGKRVRMA